MSYPQVTQFETARREAEWAVTLRHERGAGTRWGLSLRSLGFAANAPAPRTKRGAGTATDCGST